MEVGPSVVKIGLDSASSGLVPQKRKRSNADVKRAPSGERMPSLGKLLAGIADTDTRAGALASALGAPPRVAETCAPCANDEQIERFDRTHAPVEGNARIRQASADAVHITSASGESLPAASDVSIARAQQLFEQPPAACSQGSLQIMTAAGASVQPSADARAWAQQLLGIQQSNSAHAPSSEHHQLPSSSEAQHSLWQTQTANSADAQRKPQDATPPTNRRRRLKRPSTVQRKGFQPPKQKESTKQLSPQVQQQQQEAANSNGTTNEHKGSREQLHHMYEGLQRQRLAQFFGRRPFESDEGIDRVPASVRAINADTAAAWSEISSGKGLKVARQRLISAGAKADTLQSGWLTHHFRLIVWKFASYERAFPRECAGRALTIERVVDELLYRYEREIHVNKAPAMKRVLERDAPSEAPMNLCIAALRKDWKTAELTDGWYCVHAGLDDVLCEAASKGRLFAGQKLRVQGMTLEHGEACSALEAMQKVKAKLCANSARRERWDATLGPARRLIIALPHIHLDGGIVPAVQVTCVRVFDPVFLEYIDGGATKVMRSASVEHDVQAELERKRVDELEEGYSESEMLEKGNAPQDRIVRKLQKMRVRYWSNNEDQSGVIDAEFSFFTNTADDSFDIREGRTYLISNVNPQMPQGIRSPSLQLQLKGTRRTQVDTTQRERKCHKQRALYNSRHLDAMAVGQDVDISGVLLWCSGIEDTERHYKQRQRLFVADGSSDSLIFIQRLFQTGCAPSLGPRNVGHVLKVRDAFFDTKDKRAGVNQLFADESTRVELMLSGEIYDWAARHTDEIDRFKQRVQALTTGAAWNVREESNEMNSEVLDAIDELMTRGRA